jgi:hypothetical protein
VKLDAVTAQLDMVTSDSTREMSILKADLENEIEARRNWQDKAGALRERISAMVSKCWQLCSYWLIL